MIKIIIDIYLDISSVYWPKQFGVCYHRKSEGMSCTKKPANKHVFGKSTVKLWFMLGMTSWLSEWQPYYEMAILSSIWIIQLLSNGSSAETIKLKCENDLQFITIQKHVGLIDIYSYTQIILNIVSSGSKS